MEQELPRKRTNDLLMCDPALQRLRKAAKTIAIAQRIAQFQDSPSDDNPQPSGSAYPSTNSRVVSGGRNKQLGLLQPQLSVVSLDNPAAASDPPPPVAKNTNKKKKKPNDITPPKLRTVRLSPPDDPHALTSTAASLTPFSDRRQVLAETRGQHGPTMSLEPTARTVSSFTIESDRGRFHDDDDELAKVRSSIMASTAGTKEWTPVLHHHGSTANNNNSELKEEHSRLTHRVDDTPPVDRLMRFIQLLVPMMFLMVTARAFTIHGTKASSIPTPDTTMTLRDILTDQETGFHLAMAPAFFGFYGYFGALAAWYEVEPDHLPIRSIAGASAGAMAAVLIGAGVSPRHAAEFCSEMTLSQYADFPGLGAVFRGHKFEGLMEEFLQSATNRTRAGSWKLEEAVVPVAVTAFDLQSFEGKILTTGSMARAARASATFPLLFQPVGWVDQYTSKDYIFIDGGIADPNGLVGLTKTLYRAGSKRIVNLSIGSLLPWSRPLFDMSRTELITVSIHGLPQPSPFAMAKGPLAYEKARKSMLAALDTPLTKRGDRFELNIHA